MFEETALSLTAVLSSSKSSVLRLVELKGEKPVFHAGGKLVNSFSSNIE
jgi:hypothetical protein